MKNKIITVIIILLGFGLNAQLVLTTGSFRDRLGSYLSTGELNGFSGEVLIAKNGVVILTKVMAFQIKVRTWSTLQPLFSFSIATIIKHNYNAIN